MERRRVERLAEKVQRFVLHGLRRNGIGLRLPRKLERQRVPRLLRRIFRPRNVQQVLAQAEAQAPDRLLFVLPRKTDAFNIPAVKLVEFIVFPHLFVFAVVSLGIQRVPA